jgi:hypothetical protein
MTCNLGLNCDMQPDHNIIMTYNLTVIELWPVIVLYPASFMTLPELWPLLNCDLQHDPGIELWPQTCNLALYWTVAYHLTLFAHVLCNV